ncbi:MAG TPA: FtsX-like permease family protein [Candidatus Acidoferrales bacterium]|nr:FtsX-like permease family protein [Candidatus Acidoferrales bacterium]
MFWRILGQLLRSSRGRLAVALIALASGAAVTTALINLNLDAESKVSAEFRTLGANVVVLPHANASTSIIEVKQSSAGQVDSKAPDKDQLAAPLMNNSVVNRIQALPSSEGIVSAPILYIVANVPSGEASQQVIVAGTWLDRATQLAPWWKVAGDTITDRSDLSRCLVGRSVAQQLNLAPGSSIELNYGDGAANRNASLTVAGIINSGGQEDSQIITNLPVVQTLAGLEGRIGLVQVSIPGTPTEIESAIARISAALPGLDVRPVPQIAQAEGRLLDRIRGLIFFMVTLILVLTGLCVFASMAALAMERRPDVGLMKAIGGPMSRVVRLFLTEAGTLGLAGGLLGYVAGIFLSRWIGQRAFNVAISVRPEVLPLVVALMVAESLAGALPLRLLSHVRPAEILRGE